MSLVLPEIMKELEGIVKESYDCLSSDMKAYSLCTPESAQALYLHSINRNMCIWGKLSNIALRAATLISTPKQETSHEEMCQLILDGIVQYLRAARLIAFNERCCNMLPPCKVEFTDISRLRFHEMIFVPSDCFIELSNIRPGNHGWVFIFRNDLKEWFLKTLDPFTVTYQDVDGKNTVYGVYEAIQFPQGNMTGPEIACLSESTRHTILSQASKDVHKDNYKIVQQALLASHLTISCFLLQCREKPPPTSISDRGPPLIQTDTTMPSSQSYLEAQKVQYNCQIMRTDFSKPSADSRVVEAPLGELFTAPVAQAACDLQERNISRANSTTQAEDSKAGPSSAPSFVSNMAVNPSLAHVVPVPGPMPNEHGWYNEDVFYNGRGYPPPAYQNHPSKNYCQDQIQFTEGQEQPPLRLRSADGGQSASYGIPLRVSTNTRGPALGYTSQMSLQPPTSQVPPSNYRTQRDHGDNQNQNQNSNPTRTNGGFSRATAGGIHAGGYQEETLDQHFSNLRL
ncbi:hypothetical protein BDZ94DRAFT_1307799 [Collybia nuda]|uniref:Uncharacterized protein n=1 Tax=Collybia nuda TaxID=64659 RepID=A0A9P5Y9F5_9AGAR|nr:hypothetical protein BDZ94DRAFT_1307799 [Collybia nuda]